MATKNSKTIERSKKAKEPKTKKNPAMAKAAQWREIHRRLDYIATNFPGREKDIEYDIETNINEVYRTALERVFQKSQIRTRRMKPGEGKRLPLLFKPGLVLHVSDFARIDDSINAVIGANTRGEIVFAPVTGGKIEARILFEFQPGDMAGYQQASAMLILNYRDPWDDIVQTSVVEQRIPMEKDEKGWHFVCLMGEQRCLTDSLYAGYSYFVCFNCLYDPVKGVDIDEHRKQQTVAFLNVTRTGESEEDE